MKLKDILISLVLCAAMALAAGCSDEDSPSKPDGGGSPAISGILPPGAGSGTRITIRGSNFGDARGTGSVQVAGSDAAIESWSAAVITCTLPAGLSEGVGTVTVTTGSGKSSSSQFSIARPNTYRVTKDQGMNHYPCWSANGDWIYFSCALPGGTNWDIYRIPAIGGAAERVTYDAATDLYPDINPSTGELAWSSQMTAINNTDGDYEIFYGYPACIVPGSSCLVTMLTNNGARDLDPAYAITVYMGCSMAHTWEEVDQNGYFLAWKVVLRTGGLPVVLTEGRQPNFSANGQWVVYTRQDNIYKIPTGGGTPVQLTNTNHDWYPHWGWTNDKIVFQRSNGGNFEDIFVMNSDGTGVEALVSTPSNEYCPSWSPDCTKVVYYALVNGSYDIYVYVVP